MDNHPQITIEEEKVKLAKKYGIETIPLDKLIV